MGCRWRGDGCRVRGSRGVTHLSAKVIGAIVVAALLLLWYVTCQGRNTGRDEILNQRADSIRAAAIDSMAKVHVRDSVRAVFEAEQAERLRCELLAADRTEANLKAQIARIQRQTGGGGIIRVDTLAPPDTVAPQTIALIDSLVAFTGQLRGIVAQQDTLIDTLHVHVEDLRQANRIALAALLESEREVGRLKRAKSGGWRDRIKPKVSVGYQATFVRADGSVKHGPGLQVGWVLWP